jgi:hypothetical protein
MDIINSIKNLHPKKFIKFKKAGFTSDCSECNDKSGYDWSWVNDEGYGTTAWAPTYLNSTRNFGLNKDGSDYIVTYLR